MSTFNIKRMRVLTKQEQILSKKYQGIVYWMWRDQRVQDNWAMLYAQKVATEHNMPLCVCFALPEKFREAAIRQYGFMLKGLQEVEKELKKLDISFHILLGDPGKTVPSFVSSHNIGGVVTDFSPLREARNWLDEVVKSVPKDVPLFEVDAHNIVPCWEASRKMENAAATIRPKITEQLPTFLTEFPPCVKHPTPAINSEDVDWKAVYEFIKVDESVPEVTWAKPGTESGLAKLEKFKETDLKQFSTDRNDPNKHALSNLSPWFHTGQISVQRAILSVSTQKTKWKESTESFIEEALIHRELADNYCFYNKNYDSISGASDWAQKTLQDHVKDTREYVYTREQFETAKTHDKLWNAAQRQVLREGKMHGFLRMYWAKKILEWTNKPEEALSIALYLNDKYQMDGNDRNGFVDLDNKPKKVYWDEISLDFNVKEKVEPGVPFILMGKKIFDCHHGKDRSIAMKKRAELRRIELNEKRKRNTLSPGKKLNCPAQVIFNDVILFPEYKITTNTQYMRKQLSHTLKQHLKEGKVDLDKLDRRIYLSLPSNESHVGHPVGEDSDSTSERMHNKVSEKITELVEEGCTGIKEVQRRLEVFVNTQLCPELWKPCHTNRRYYPTKGVIRNKMYHAFMKRRLHLIDHEVVNELLKERQDKNPEDGVFFRACHGIDEMRLYALSGISVEEELEDYLKIRQRFAEQQMIFVHQTSFQRHLLKRYGNHVCFLDPVYRTVKYPLPLFFVMVKTNVDYQAVATFVVQDENMESTKEALEFIKVWNPEWKPKVFMVDNDNEEFLALEEVFTDCKVFINDFHRVQAWEKWLSQSSNHMTPYKDAMLCHLHRLAKATSTEQFEKRLDDLKRSDVWTDSYGKMFRTWFENSWLAVKERWAWCFKEESYTSVLTTNNTFEAQKKDFSHEQLVGNTYLTLVQIIKVLTEVYLPRNRDIYYEQNADILTGASSKYTNLPDVFHNRPRWVIDHISERITSSYDISCDDITVDSYKEGEFLVNCRRSDVEYKVEFGNNEKYPHCDCIDWCTTMLPCKHFVAVMRDIKDWSWSKFPESYRCSPYLTLDEIVNPKPPEEHEESTSKADGSTDNTEGTVSVLDSSQFHELTFPKLNSRSKSSVCRDLLNEINNVTYSLSDDDVINRLNSALDDVLGNLKLSFVEDEIVLEPEEVESKSIKTEEKPKGLGKKLKRSSTSKVSPGAEGNGDEPPRKITKPSENPPTMSYNGNETIEEQVLEEMNHMEILNIDYYRQADTTAAVASTSAEGHAEDVQESKGDNQEHKEVVSQGGTAGVSQGETYIIDQKKVDDVTVIEVKTPTSLPKYEARLVQRHEMLTVDSINLAQSILHEMFPHLKGFQTVARGAVQAFLPVTGDFIQILHDGSLHWVCTANISLTGGKDPAAVNMYDSMNQGFIAKFTKQQLASFLCIQSAEMKVIMKSVQQQTSHVDCGVFAIAFATALAFGEDPSKLRFDVPKMRPHLVECLKLKKLSPFPEMKPGCSDVVLSKRKFYTVELFCSCRMPYEKPKSEADLMAQCGSCKEWFHQRCEKIALEIFKTSGMSFLCALCLKRE